MRRGLTCVAALAVLGLVPSVAAAATRYVDAETGVDAGVDCAIGAPCETIAYAITTSSAGDEILVDSGTYGESVTLGDGRSLAYQDFVPGDGTGPAIVDGAAGTAVTVPASGAGHIRGLTIRGDVAGVLLNGVAEVGGGNIFDDPDSINGVGVNVGSGGAGSTVHDNNFLDPNPSTARGRGGIFVAGAAEVRDNSIAGFNVGIAAHSPSGGDTLVEGNTITQTHNLPTQGRGISVQSFAGFGVVTLRANLVSAASGSGVIGVMVSDTNVRLVRNEITGQQTGVFLLSDSTGITIEGDRIWGNAFDGLALFDTGTTAPQTNATVTNVTIVANEGADFRADSSTLTLDSSIVETPAWSGSAACTITHSRADADPDADPSGCDDFQFTADPMLADAANGDLHLLPGSPMIDVGDPADPGATFDLDGDPRAVVGTSECVERRDIGTDEFVPNPPIDCQAPETTIESGPAEGESINEATPTFVFSSDEPGATFDCDVNGAGFSPCSHTTQHILGPLVEGGYTFAVRAVDAADNEDPTPAERSFTVDLTDPVTSFTKKPPRKTRRKHVRFGFAADEEATFKCRLDSKPAFDCTSPERLRVRPGRHLFRVTAADEAGNADATPAAFRFRRLRPR
jgi:Right handed beta helix region